MLALLARHGTNLLPLLLQFNETVAGCLPVRAVLQRLGFLDDGHLLGQVLVHGILELGEGGALALEELVAGSAETVVDLLVFLTGGKADGAPLGLDILNLLGEGVPLRGGGDFLIGDGLYLFAEGLLGFQVLGLLFLEAFEVGLVFLVHHGSGGAETLPDGIAVLLGHGAQVFPLLVQFLQLLEGFHHVLVLTQGLGLLAESGLGFQVLLEVQVAEFAVDVYQVVELGHVQLVGIVDVTEILLGHRANLSPAVLDVAELGEGFLHISGLFHQGLQLFDDGLLLLQVLLTLGVLLLIIFGALFLVFHIEGLEAGLNGSERAHRAALHGNGGIFHGRILVRFLHGGVFAGFGLFAGKALIEGRFQSLGLLGPLHAVFTGFQLLEQLRQFGKGLLTVVHGGFLDLFHSILDAVYHLYGLVGHGGYGVLHFLHDGSFFYFLFLLGYICGFIDHRLNFFTHSI